MQTLSPTDRNRSSSSTGGTFSSTKTHSSPQVIPPRQPIDEVSVAAVDAEADGVNNKTKPVKRGVLKKTIKTTVEHSSMSASPGVRDDDDDALGEGQSQSLSEKKNSREKKKRGKSSEKKAASKSSSPTDDHMTAEQAHSITGDVEMSEGRGCITVNTVKLKNGKLFHPMGIAFHEADSHLFVADYGNHRVCRIGPESPPTMSVFLGRGMSGFRSVDNENATTLQKPTAVATTRDGHVYVVDHGNHCIRKFTIQGDSVFVVGTVGEAGNDDGEQEEAQFHYPCGIAVYEEEDGSHQVFVSDTYNHRVCTISHYGTVTTLAGNGMLGFNDGRGTAAEFHYPRGIAIDQRKRLLYVADELNHCIRSVTIDEGDVALVAGNLRRGFRNGPLLESQFDCPGDLSISKDGDILLADRKKNCIRMVSFDKYGGEVVVLVGNGARGKENGSCIATQFDGPAGIATAMGNFFYVTDCWNNTVRKLYIDVRKLDRPGLNRVSPSVSEMGHLALGEDSQNAHSLGNEYLNRERLGGNAWAENSPLPEDDFYLGEASASGATSSKDCDQPLGRRINLLQLDVADIKVQHNEARDARDELFREMMEKVSRTISPYFNQKDDGSTLHDGRDSAGRNTDHNMSSMDLSDILARLGHLERQEKRLSKNEIKIADRLDHLMELDKERTARDNLRTAQFTAAMARLELLETEMREMAAMARLDG